MDEIARNHHNERPLRGEICPETSAQVVHRARGADVMGSSAPAPVLPWQAAVVAGGPGQV